MRGRFPSFRSSRALLACVPILGLVMVANAGAASAARAPVSARTAVRATLEHLLAHVHGGSIAQPGASPNQGTSLKQVSSLDWAGHADSGAVKYSEVSGSWPSLRPSARPRNR
jgi:hypothetical protein